MKYLKPLIEQFNQNANAEKAVWMKNYMKGHFDFFGINTKERRDIQKVFFNTYGYPEQSEFLEIVKILWKLEQREFQYLAIELLQKFSKNIRKEDISNIELLITTKSWWDSVDGLAVWICGDYFRFYPEQIVPVTDKWIKSGKMWLQRSVLLYQLNYKSDTDTNRLFGWIKELAEHKDFFIRKAIGWILREYSKTNPEWVIQLIQSVELSGLSKREGLKHINKNKSD